MTDFEVSEVLQLIINANNNASTIKLNKLGIIFTKPEIVVVD